MAEVIRFSFSTVNVGERQDNGGWKVTSTLTEEWTFVNGTSRAEKIDAMCFDNDEVNAQQVALHSALVSYREEVIDKGFSNLVEARMAKENDDFKDNPNTPTQ
jgi:hypothetical protein